MSKSSQAVVDIQNVVNNYAEYYMILAKNSLDT